MHIDSRILALTALMAVLLAASWGAARVFAADDGIPQAGPPATHGAPTDGSASRANGDVAAIVLARQDVQGILGRQVLSSAGEDMGRVVDIVVDRSGQVRAAVIDFGGFLGVGNRKVAIDWNALHFAPTGSREDRITLDLTREQVKAAPEYRDGAPLIMLGAADSVPAAPP
ncbi:MAG TPA: PRC-barrel domain-containing protein [Xanthobacteraceae bacterium]|nr:PRC-barrel domain-containing protein [Xanthobacteraceae bacterium]